MTAIYAAMSLCIDSCPVQGFDPAGYLKVPGLPASLVPSLLVPPGHAADRQKPETRFLVEEIVFNETGQQLVDLPERPDSRAVDDAAV